MRGGAADRDGDVEAKVVVVGRCKDKGTRACTSVGATPEGGLLGVVRGTSSLHLLLGGGTP